MSLIPNTTTQSKSHYILISPPQSLGNGSWIFKDQDYQLSSLSEKVFLSPPLPPHPNLHRTFFSHISQKYNNNQSSCGSDPPLAPLF